MQSFYAITGLFVAALLVALGDAALSWSLEPAGLALLAQFTVVGPANFAQPAPTNPRLQRIAMAYRNQNLIFRDVLPEGGVSTESYKYFVWDENEPFTVPDTRVSRRGQVNQVEFSGREVSGSVQEYGLDVSIPIKDVRMAEASESAVRPSARAVERVMKYVELQREKRCADLIFNPATYPAANKETLSGASQWSHADTDPIDAIATASDRLVYRPNVLVLGQEAWTKFRQHAKVNKAVNRSDGDSGLAMREAVAEALEIETILVGMAWINSSRPGQAAALARCWGKHAALLYIDKSSNPSTPAEADPTFGWTARWGERIATSWTAMTAGGLEGCEMARAGERVGEHIVANALGYFFENAVAS